MFFHIFLTFFVQRSRRKNTPPNLSKEGVQNEKNRDYHDVGSVGPTHGYMGDGRVPLYNHPRRTYRLGRYLCHDRRTLNNVRRGGRHQVGQRNQGLSESSTKPRSSGPHLPFRLISTLRRRGRASLEDDWNYRWRYLASGSGTSAFSKVPPQHDPQVWKGMEIQTSPPTRSHEAGDQLLRR